MGTHTIGNLDNAPQTVGSYIPHKRRSSEITVLTTEGIIRKEKKRKDIKALREFFALHVWHTLLGEYNSQDGNDMIITSPEPYQLDAQRRIYMGFVPGTVGQNVMNLFYSDTPLAPAKRRGVRLDFARHMGRLMRLKEVEKLAHSDFDLRHVLFSIAPFSQMGVIDLESSIIGEEATEQTANENREMRTEMLRLVESKKTDAKKQVSEKLDEGYESITDPHSIIQDVIAAVREDLPNIPGLNWEKLLLKDLKDM